MRSEIERLSLLDRFDDDDDVRLYQIAGEEVQLVDEWLNCVVALLRLAWRECSPLAPAGLQEVHMTGWLFVNASSRRLALAQAVFDRLPRKGRMTDAAVSLWKRQLDKVGANLKHLAKLKHENRKSKVC